METWNHIVDRRSPVFRRVRGEYLSAPGADVMWNVFRTLEFVDRLEILSHSSCIYPHHVPVAKLVDYGPKYYYWGVSEEGKPWEPLSIVGERYPLRIPEVVIEGDRTLYYIEHISSGGPELCPFVLGGGCLGEGCPILGRIRESGLVRKEAFFFDREYIEHADCNIYHQVLRAVAAGSVLARLQERRPRFVFILNEARSGDLSSIESAFVEATGKTTADAELRLTSWQAIRRKVERAVARGHRDTILLQKLEDLFLYLNGPEFKVG